MNSLDGAGKLGVRRLVRGFDVIVVALCDHFVLEQKLGAIQLVVGTDYFDFRLIVIGSRRRNFAALDEANGLPLGYVLPGPHIQFDQSTGDLREDMDHPGGVRHHARGEHQPIGD